MNLTSLIPETLMMESGARRRLYAALANVSDAAHAAAVAAFASASGKVVTRPGYTMTPAGVALIEFHGVSSKDFSLFGLLFGGQACTEYALAGLNGALADGQTKILFDFDTPGGDVRGIYELGEAIWRARARARVWGQGSDRIQSAGYWLGSQCERLTIGKNTEAGCIGARYEQLDDERAELNAGIDRRSFASSPGKLDPPDAMYQQMAGDLGGNFDEAVARGRGISLAAARALADGLTYIGPRAVARGLADGIATLEEIVGALAAEPENTYPVSVSIQIPEPCEAADDCLDCRARGIAPKTKKTPAKPVRAEAVARPTAKQEDTMSDLSTEALKRLDDLEAKFKASSEKQTALETENASLRVQLGAHGEVAKTIAGRVDTIEATKELDSLVAQARTDRKIRGGTEKGSLEATVRDVAKHSMAAARELVASLKAEGPEGGSVVEDGKGKDAKGADLPKHRFDPFGAATSTDPKFAAFGEKIRWIERAEAAGTKFKTAAEALTKAEAALSASRAA